MRARRFPSLAFLSALVWAAMLGCTYAPDFDNGKLLCGSKGSCPKGYHCEAGHLCYKDGTTANGTGGGSGTGGNGGGTGGTSGGTVSSRNDLVGAWAFSGGTLDVNCSDGTSQSKPLTSADEVDVSLGSGNTITGDFYCNWVLNLAINAGIATTSLPSGQTCMSTSGCSDFTWMGKSFNFVSDDGASAMLDAAINATYKDYTSPATMGVCLPKATTTPTTGSCMLTVSGTLDKK